MMVDKEEHWNNVYCSRKITQLGWYEEIPNQSLYLLNKCNINKDELIVDAGAGASTFIDNLIGNGYNNIVAVDISCVALEELKQRLGDNAARVNWIVDDLTQSQHIQELRDVAVWHDRAVLHFLTEETEREAYLKTLLQVLKPNGGYVIIAAFSLDGAPKCSGLDVRRYDKEMLQEFFGGDFKVLEHFKFLYRMPSGDIRPYIYTLFKRNNG